MKKKTNKSNKTIIIVIVVMSICLLGILAILVCDLITRLSRGWTNNDTITLIFFVMIAVTGVIFIKSFHDYFVNHNKEIIMLNNDIYRLFFKMEKEGSISNYEKLLIDRENKRYLGKINSIIQKKNKDLVITLDNINDYFYAISGFFKGDTGLLASYRLSTLYNKIRVNKSINYEKLYRNVHSGDLIKNVRFPLFESLVPLLIGFVGIFVTIYQTLAVDGSINDSLIEYLKLFGSVVLFAAAYTLFTYRSYKEGVVNYKTNILTDLEIALKQ